MTKNWKRMRPHYWSRGSGKTLQVSEQMLECFRYERRFDPQSNCGSPRVHKGAAIEGPITSQPNGASSI